MNIECLVAETDVGRHGYLSLVILDVSASYIDHRLLHRLYVNALPNYQIRSLRFSPPPSHEKSFRFDVNHSPIALRDFEPKKIVLNIWPHHPL